MSETIVQETISRVFNDFLGELDKSHLSRDLIAVYKELGIEP